MRSGEGRRWYRRIVETVMAALLVVACGGPVQAGAPMLLVTGEERVTVGRGFPGGYVALFGLAPEDSEIYVVARGPEKKVPLDRHGRGAVGFLTVETVTVGRLPGFYQILSSGPLEKLPPDLQWETGATPDYRALQAQAVVWQSEYPEGRLGSDEAASYVQNLFRIYEKQGLYGVREGAIVRHGPAYFGRLVLPRETPAGRIEIRAFAVRNGVLLASATSAFTVERAGLLGAVNWEGGNARTSVVVGTVVAVLAAAAAVTLIRRIVRVLNP